MVYIVGNDSPEDPNNARKEIVRLNVKTFDPMQAHRDCMFSAWPAHKIWQELNSMISKHGDERQIKGGSLRVVIEA